MVKTQVLILAGVVILVGVGGWYWGRSGKTITKPIAPATANLNPPQQMVGYQVGSTKIKVEVRDAQEERELGLSYRKTMGEDEGMLFVFDSPAQYAFWMKDMEFPLDMLWIKDNRVVEISTDLPAPKLGELPVTVTPELAVDKVLEVNGGWVRRHGVIVGAVVGSN